jgi:hypothetical protein
MLIEVLSKENMTLNSTIHSQNRKIKVLEIELKKIQIEFMYNSFFQNM